MPFIACSYRFCRSFTGLCRLCWGFVWGFAPCVHWMSAEAVDSDDSGNINRSWAWMAWGAHSNLRFSGSETTTMIPSGGLSFLWRQIFATMWYSTIEGRATVASITVKVAAKRILPHLDRSG